MQLKFMAELLAGEANLNMRSMRDVMKKFVEARLTDEVSVVGEVYGFGLNVLDVEIKAAEVSDREIGERWAKLNTIGMWDSKLLNFYDF